MYLDIAVCVCGLIEHTACEGEHHERREFVTHANEKNVNDERNHFYPDSTTAHIRLMVSINIRYSCQDVEKSDNSRTLPRAMPLMAWTDALNNCCK